MTIEPIVISKACFEAALSQSSVELQHIEGGWRAFPKLTTEDESFQKRMDDIQKGIKGRINLASELKKLVKDWGIGYEYKKSVDGDICLEKIISDSVTLGLIIDKIHHFGIGKAFSLRIYLIDKAYGDNHFTWYDDLFRVFGITQTDRPCYTYAIKADLEAIMLAMKELCIAIMPIIEKNIKDYFLNNSDKRINTLTVRKNFSAKNGCLEATTVAKEWDEDSKLSGILLQPYIELRQVLGTSVGIDGYLKQSAYWSYRFYSPNKKYAVLLVAIPAVGNLSYKIHKFGEFYSNTYPFSEWVKPIHEPYIDSTDAILAAESLGGEKARTSGNTFDILMNLEFHKGHLCWAIRYLIVKNKARCDFEVVINASNGEFLAKRPYEIKDER